MNLEDLEGTSSLFKIIMKEHTELFDCIDKIDHNSKLANVVCMFVNHIRAEEYMMIKINYPEPEFTRHKNEHLRVINECMSLSYFPITALRIALRSLFTSHLNDYDMKILEHTQDCENKIVCSEAI